jgi:hypothetical protein
MFSRITGLVLRRLACTHSLVAPRASRFLSPRVRFVHAFPSRSVYEPLPYKNEFEVFRYYVQPKDYSRTVRLDNLASFAIEEDIRTLLEESGYHPELVLM